MTLVAALGDSLTCGVGVGVQVDPDATWVALLADSLPDGRLLRLAVPGARVADVRSNQLPQLPDRVNVATLLIGLNDIARSGFTAATVCSDVQAVVSVVAGRADCVLLGRLHDPTVLLPLPARVAQAARHRIACVNAAIDQAARRTGVHVLDIGRVLVLEQPGGWSVDRIHPSPAGHRGMAVAASEVLRAAGQPLVKPIGGVAAVPRRPSRRARGWWVVRHAVPYAAGHLRDVGGPAVSVLRRRE